MVSGQTGWYGWMGGLEEWVDGGLVEWVDGWTSRFVGMGGMGAVCLFMCTEMVK